MAGISKLLNAIRNEFEMFRIQSRKRFGEIQSKLDSLETRLDNLDTPKQTQAGAKARKAERGTRRRPVPVPERPEIMKDAGVGVDPR